MKSAAPRVRAAWQGRTYRRDKVGSEVRAWRSKPRLPQNAESSSSPAAPQSTVTTLSFKAIRVDCVPRHRPVGSLSVRELQRSVPQEALSLVSSIVETTPSVLVDARARSSLMHMTSIASTGSPS